MFYVSMGIIVLALGLRLANKINNIWQAILTVAGLILLAVFGAPSSPAAAIEASRDSEMELRIVDLRIPGKWREAGTWLVQQYPHDPEGVTTALVDHILPESEVLAGRQMRNAPLIWVMVMIGQAYGPLPFTGQQRAQLAALQRSREYETDESYRRQMTKLIQIQTAE